MLNVDVAVCSVTVRHPRLISLKSELLDSPNDFFFSCASVQKLIVSPCCEGVVRDNRPRGEPVHFLGLAFCCSRVAVPVRQPPLDVIRRRIEYWNLILNFVEVVQLPAKFLM